MKTKQLIQSLALKYERYKDQLDQIDPVEINLYRKDIEQAYDRLPKPVGHYEHHLDGYGGHDEYVEKGFRVEFVDGQPYQTLKEMTDSILNDDVLFVSKDHNESTLLPGELNLKFRAVHDYLHYLFQQPLDFKGELNVYKTQKFFHSTEIGKRILYSEIVMQAAYCTYFGKFATKQKVIIC